MEIKIHFSGIIMQYNLYENNLISLYYNRTGCLNWLHIIDTNNSVLIGPNSGPQLNF